MTFNMLACLSRSNFVISVRTKNAHFSAITWIHIRLDIYMVVCSELCAKVVDLVSSESFFSLCLVGRHCCW